MNLCLYPGYIIQTYRLRVDMCYRRGEREVRKGVVVARRLQTREEKHVFGQIYALLLTEEISEFPWCRPVSAVLFVISLISTSRKSRMTVKNVYPILRAALHPLYPPSVLPPSAKLYHVSLDILAPDSSNQGKILPLSFSLFLSLIFLLPLSQKGKRTSCSSFYLSSTLILLVSSILGSITERK